MAATAQELLDSCNDAIKALQDGGAASRGLGDRRWEGLSLADLMGAREKLKAEIASESIAGGTVRPIKSFGLRMREVES